MAAGPQQVWQQRFTPPVRISVAAETASCLVLDGQGGLTLLDIDGRMRGKTTPGEKFVAAAISGRGGAILAATTSQLVWFDIALSEQRREAAGGRPLAVAVDPPGWYGAVAFAGGDGRIMDCYGRKLTRLRSPRPLDSLEFLWGEPLLLTGSEGGVICKYAPDGSIPWRLDLASRVGPPAAPAAGEPVLVPGFGQGLLRFDAETHSLGPLLGAEMPSRVAVDARGELLLLATLEPALALVSRSGQGLWNQHAEDRVDAISLDPLARYAWYALANGRLACLQLPVQAVVS